VATLARVVLALAFVGQSACTRQFDPVEADATLPGFGGARETAPDCVDASLDGVRYRACATLENWADAAAACAAWGGGLVTFDSAQEERAVTDFAYQHGTANYWLGATDIEVEGVWHWQDGTVFWDHGQVPDGQYAHWHTGEPGNTSSMSTADEDCAYIYREQGWNDVDCSFERAYVCEGR
jgi:Lectin C-type domain